MKCPSPNDWRRFDAGRLDPQQQADWTSHLDACQRCADVLESLVVADDPLLARLRDQADDKHAPDSELDQMLRRAARLDTSAAATTLDHVVQSDTLSNRDIPADESPVLPAIAGYRLHRLIGRGGMGIVYQAEHLALKRQVAIKTLREGQLADGEQVVRFRREAEAAAALNHPNIVPVFEVGKSNGLHYFSMAYVEGMSLERLARREPLSVRRSAEIVRQLADAVGFAHQRGVVHRDLKPENVLMDQAGSPHITDFGIARRTDVDDPLTVTGQVMGTLGYMSPEQASGARQVQAASDIYSLGAILYRLLTGRPPFESSNVVEALQKVVEQEPVRPRVVRSELDRDIETICLKCLSKSASARYATAEELSADLRRYLAGEPIRARPLGALARVARWCRRKPAVTAAMFVLVLLLSITASAVVQGNRSGAKLQLQQHWTEYRQRLADLDSLRVDDEIEQSIQRLGQFGVEHGRQARDEYRDALRQLWERRLMGAQRLTPQDLQWLEAGLASLESRGAPNLDALKLRLTQRRSDWQTEFHLQALQHDVPVEFQTRLHLRDGLFWPANGRPKGADRTRWLTSFPCSTACEMQVEFAAGWEAAEALGVLLSADDTGGYEFVLRRGLQPDDPGWYVEIRRAGSTLLREPVQVGPAGSPLRIWARREQARLTVQIGTAPALDFDDAMMLRMKPDLVFGLLWPSEIGVSDMRARRRLLPESATPLEEADQLLADGRLEAALQVYESLASTSQGTSDRGELLYKQGLCHWLLERKSAAVDLLEQGMRRGDVTWSVRAACQLWHMHIVAGDMPSAELVLDQVRGLDFASAAVVVPAEVRQRILQAYQASSGGIANLLQFDPRRIEKARLAVEVESRLNQGGQPSHATLMRLFEAYDLAGHNRSARQVMDRLLAGNVDGLRGYYTHHYLRHLRLIGETKLAQAEIERSAATLTGQDRWWIEVERFRLHAARQEWQQAHDALAEVVRSDPQSTPVHDLKAQSWLAMGFLRHHLGAEEESSRIWREATAQLRDQRASSKVAAGSDLVNFVAMAALAEDLTTDDLEQLLGQAEQAHGAVATALQIIPRSTVLNSMRAAWNSPRGRQLAEQLALDQIPRGEQVQSCAQLIGAAYFRLGAFPEPASADQEQLVWDLAGDIFQRGVLAGEFDPSTASALLGVWADKFGTGLAIWQAGGWKSLPADLRGRVAYVLGMRFAMRGNASAAEILLRQAQQEAHAVSDNRLLRLVEQALPAKPAD